MFKLIMSSREFGRETFKYDTYEEAIAGQRRIEAEIAKRKDGIIRTFTIQSKPVTVRK